MRHRPSNAMRPVPTAIGLIAVFAGAMFWPGSATAQMTHDHPGIECADPGLACATTVSPAFAPDGNLWLAWPAAGRVSVARSRDLARTFEPAVPVNRGPQRLDSGPDERPKIAVDASGRIAVAYAIFKDSAFNGQVLYSRSTDGGRSFAPPLPITADPESQRFEAVAFDPAGDLSPGSTSAIARPRASGARVTSARVSRLPGPRTGPPPLPKRALPRTTPASAAGLEWHSRGRAVRWSYSATCSAGQYATTPSRHSPIRRPQVRSIE